MRSRYLAVPLVAVALVSTAWAAPSEQAIRDAVSKINPEAVIKSITATPIKGVSEVRAEGAVVYASDDGKYLFVGDIYDVSARTNLTELAKSGVRKELLASSDPTTHLRFGPKGAKHVVYVFTDTSCSFCQRFHQEVPKLVDAGIAVEYLAWPRTGPQGPVFTQMQSVWCASDPEAAYDSAVKGEDVPLARCSNPVATHFQLGQEMEIHGTPAIFDKNGRQLGGYVPAEQLIEMLGQADAG